MTSASLRRVLCVRCLLVTCIWTGVPGCQKEEPDVRHYSVPKPQIAPPLPDQATHDSQRLLGAIIPWNDELWVIKMMGPDAIIKDLAIDFAGFLESLTFENGKKAPTYKAPEGWQSSKGTQFSVAAFKKGGEPFAPELTVTPTRGTVLENVNRWRVNQLGLKEVNDDELKQTSKEKKFGDATGIIVSLAGSATGGGRSMSRPPFAGRPPMPDMPNPHATAASPVRYTVPQGWEPSKELTKGFVRREAVFNIRDGSRSAEANITISGGALLDNINRWRHEVGLGDIRADQLSKEATPFIIAGEAATYVDVSGQAGGASSRRVPGAILPHKGQTWFFLMRGPADLVGREKPAFEAFLKSVRFEGDANE